jgi:CRISPR-associated protein Csm3
MNQNDLRLIGIKEIKGTLILKSGLHIGSGDTEMRIGGTDNPVIKHPHTQEPFIPGSSIKGKVRSLLEMRSGLMVQTDGNPVGLKLCEKLTGSLKTECEKILKLFGSSGADAESGPALGPTRVSFSDCSLSASWKEKAAIKRWAATEIKSENSIDRIRGTAKNPRFTERVPAGTEFDFSVSFKEFQGEEGLLEILLEGLKLLEMDALGGSGSRGYGRMALKFNDPMFQEKFDNSLPFSREG